MIKPCFDGEVLINPRDDPTCNPGSPWSQYFSQRIMGGDYMKNVSIVNNLDNFHRVYAIKPVHLPKIGAVECQASNYCTMNTASVSELHYD